MKIAFYCGSLEPGRDGIGDYIRRLAGELSRRNHSCVAVALNDTYIFQTRVEEQSSEGVAIPMLRISHLAPWSRRVADARAWLVRHEPDWMSLQYVPFAFHPRGLCMELGRSLAALNPGAPWHVMFHELWLGLGQDSPLKARIWGAWQRGITSDCLRRLRPKVLHTQAEPYRLALQSLDVEAAILPLFSNIPLAIGDGWAGLVEPLVTREAVEHLGREDLFLAGVLGSVHSEWNVDRALEVVLPLVRKSNRRLVLVLIGKNNLSKETVQKMKAGLRDRALVVATGERSPLEISQILQTLDMGMATTPLQAIQKSGSVVAMFEHGLSVLVTRDDWHLRGAVVQLPENDQLLTPQQFAALTALPKREAVQQLDRGIKQVADQMLAALQSSAPVALTDRSVPAEPLADPLP